MDINIFGIIGHREVTMPLEQLDVEELEVGRELVFEGKIYEIRSLTEMHDHILMNVVIVMGEHTRLRFFVRKAKYLVVEILHSMGPNSRHAVVFQQPMSGTPTPKSCRLHCQQTCLNMRVTSM